MAKLFAVLGREYFERVRSRWFVLATVFGPVIFGALMFLPSIIASKDRASAEVGRILVLDATGTTLGERVASRLGGGLDGAGDRTRVRALPPSELAPAESLATQAVIADSVRGYLVLDSATLAGVTARYAGTNTTAIAEMSVLERAVQREVLAMRLEGAGLDAETSGQLTRVNVNVATERISKRGRGGPALTSFFFGLAVAMLLYMTIFIYGLNVMRGVLEEKQTRVAEVVVASVSTNGLLIGKVLGVGAVGLTQMGIWMLVGYGMWQVRAPLLARFGVTSMNITIPDLGIGTAAAMLGFFVLGFLFYAGLFAAAGATVSSEQEAQQAQMPVVLLLITSVLFVQNVLLQPSGTLATVMSMLPFSAPIVMPLRMSVTDVPPLQVAGALGGVALAAVAATWIAARIYRVGLLMYGKRAGVREVLAWIGRR
jgi:ABC-2 type transport system permease protein